MKIIGIDHYSIWVNDLELSARFYVEVLGLQQIERPDFNFEGAWFALGSSQQLHLISGRTTEVAAGSRKNHLAILIDSVRKAHSTIESNQPSCIVKGPKQRPDGHWQLFITDPDGYFIELTSPPNS